MQCQTHSCYTHTQKVYNNNNGNNENLVTMMLENGNRMCRSIMKSHKHSFIHSFNKHNEYPQYNGFREPQRIESEKEKSQHQKKKEYEMYTCIDEPEAKYFPIGELTNNQIDLKKPMAMKSYTVFSVFVTHFQANYQVLFFFGFLVLILFIIL